MNYIKEINAFYDWLELNELTKSAVLLWHALMHLNNKSGWQESFTVARSVIEAKTGLKKDAYYTARNQLKQAGLIDFKERGTKATVFRMFSLSEKQTTNQISDDNLSEKQTRDQTISQTTNQTKTPTTTQTINKLNKTKQNETISTAADNNRRVNCFDEYHICFGRQPSPIQLQEIISFIEKDGISEEAVCVAFRKAAEIGASYSYARKILNSWAQKSIRTLADVEKEQKNFEQRKKHASSKLSVIRQEKLPEWFYESENNSTDNDMTDEQLQIKKRRIEEKLKKYREAKEG